MQIATPRADFAVDVLAVGLGPLLPLLADPAREVVLHAAEYDVMCLKREWGVTLGRIFDTHAAAKVLGIERVGLGNLLSDELGVLLTEDEQRSDWGRRPLSPEQLAYAFADVQHLLALRERMGVRLSERGLLSEAEAEFARLTAKVDAMRAALDGVDCWVSGVRRVDSETRAGAAKFGWDRRFGLWKLNPLADWDDKRVWNHIKDHHVPYNPLHDQGYPSIGCMPCTSKPGDGEDARSGRWAGTDRTECGING